METSDGTFCPVKRVISLQSTRTPFEGKPKDKTINLVSPLMDVLTLQPPLLRVS